MGKYHCSRGYQPRLQSITKLPVFRDASAEGVSPRIFLFPQIRPSRERAIDAARTHSSRRTAGSAHEVEQEAGCFRLKEADGYFMFEPMKSAVEERPTSNDQTGPPDR
jgi:hypothetical protein